MSRATSLPKTSSLPRGVSRPVDLLPKGARDLLIAASKTPEKDRIKEIDKAIDKVKMMYPRYFIHDEEGVTP